MNWRTFNEINSNPSRARCKHISRQLVKSVVGGCPNSREHFSNAARARQQRDSGRAHNWARRLGLIQAAGCAKVCAMHELTAWLVGQIRTRTFHESIDFLAETIAADKAAGAEYLSEESLKTLRNEVRLARKRIDSHANLPGGDMDMGSGKRTEAEPQGIDDAYSKPQEKRTDHNQR
jgi:hypothetical protein